MPKLLLICVIGILPINYLKRDDKWVAPRHAQLQRLILELCGQQTS